MASKLKPNAKYDVNEILHDSLCSNCGKPLEFEVYPDADANFWRAECSCGIHTCLSQSSEVECYCENEDGDSWEPIPDRTDGGP